MSELLCRYQFKTSDVDPFCEREELPQRLNERSPWIVRKNNSTNPEDSSSITACSSDYQLNKAIRLEEKCDEIPLFGLLR